MGMIERFNREQAVFGGLFIGAGVLILLFTWMIVRAVLAAASVITLYPESSFRGFAALVPVALLVVGWYRWWRTGERYRVFKDKLFEAGVRRERGEDLGPFAVGDEEEAVSGIRELFAQILLGGPRLIFTGMARIQSRLPKFPDLEDRMRVLLELLRQTEKWQPAMLYVDQSEELGALMRCGLVEFSARKMLLKAVSDRPQLAPPDDAEALPAPASPEPLTPSAPALPIIPAMATSEQSIKPIAKMSAPVKPPPKELPPSPSAPTRLEEGRGAESGPPV